MCVRTFFIFADGPCSHCVRKGHTIEDVLNMLYELQISEAFRHFSYRQMFDSLRQIPGYSQCDRALNTGWTAWTRSRNQSSTEPKRRVRLLVDTNQMVDVCSGTATVTSYTNEYVAHTSRRNNFETIARVYRIGSYMPCPRAVMEQYDWYFSADKVAYYADTYDWMDHVDRMSYRGRHRDLGLNGVPHPAAYDLQLGESGFKPSSSIRGINMVISILNLGFKQVRKGLSVADNEVLPAKM